MSKNESKKVLRASGIRTATTPKAGKNSGKSGQKASPTVDPMLKSGVHNVGATQAARKRQWEQKQREVVVKSKAGALTNRRAIALTAKSHPKVDSLKGLPRDVALKVLWAYPEAGTMDAAQVEVLANLEGTYSSSDLKDHSAKIQLGFARARRAKAASFELFTKAAAQATA